MKLSYLKCVFHYVLDTNLPPPRFCDDLPPTYWPPYPRTAPVPFAPELPLSNSAKVIALYVPASFDPPTLFGPLTHRIKMSSAACQTHLYPPPSYETPVIKFTRRPAALLGKGTREVVNTGSAIEISESSNFVIKVVDLFDYSLAFKVIKTGAEPPVASGGPIHKQCGDFFRKLPARINCDLKGTL